MTKVTFTSVPIVERDRKYLNVFYILPTAQTGQIGINTVTSLTELESKIKNTHNKYTYKRLAYLVDNGLIKLNLLRPHATNGATSHNHIGNDLTSLTQLNAVTTLYSYAYNGLNQGVYSSEDITCVDRIKNISGVGTVLANTYGKTYYEDDNTFEMRIIGSINIKDYTDITGVSYLSSDELMIIVYKNNIIEDIKIVSKGSDYIGDDISFLWSNDSPDFSYIDLLVGVEYGDDGLYDAYGFTLKDYKNNSDSIIMIVDNDNDFTDNINQILSDEFHIQYLYYLDDRLYNDEADLKIFTNSLPNNKNITLVPSYNHFVEEDSITKYEVPYIYNYLKELSIVHKDMYKVFANNLSLPNVSYPAQQRFNSSELSTNKIMNIVNGVVFTDRTLYNPNNALSSTTVNILYNYIKLQYYKVAKKWIGKKFKIYSGLIEHELDILTERLGKIGLIDSIRFELVITGDDKIEINITFNTYQWMDDILINVLYNR